MSYLLGELLLSMILWGYMLTGLMITREIITVLWCATIAILIIMARLRCSSSLLERPVFRMPKPDLFGWITAGAIIAIFLGIITQPVIDWDAMSFWIMKAKIFFYQQHLDLSYTHKNYYPLLWPIINAGQFILLGDDSNWLASWSVALFFIIFILQLVGACKILRIKSKIIAPILLVFLAACVYEEPMLAAKAENAFLAYTAGMVTSLMLWFRLSKAKNYAWLIILMAIGITVAKFEGFLTSFLLGASLLWLIIRGHIHKKNIWIIFCLMAAVPLIEVLWIFWTKLNNFHNPIEHLQSQLTLDKIKLIVYFSFTTLIKSRMFIFSMMTSIFLLLWKNKRPWNEEERCFLYLTCLLLSFSTFFAYCGWPNQYIDGGVQDGVIRLSLHVSPILFVLFCSRLVKNG